ncbi:MAG: hypothetical protein AAGK97_18660, partial [Bacteroidota bacterium]
SSYLWTGPNNFSSSLQNPIVSDAGMYILTVTDADGCTSSLTYEVLDNTELPSVNASANGVITCSNTSVSLTGNTDIANPIYTWTDPDGNVISNMETATANASGDYTFTVRNPENGCENSTIVTVEGDFVEPNISASNNGPITCDNPNVMIMASTTSNVSFSWTGPGGFTSTQQNVSVSFPGTYIVTATDNVNGCTKTASTIVGADVTGPPIFVVTDTITCVDVCATLSVNTPIQNASFVWTDIGGNLVGNTRTVEVCEPGFYVVSVTNLDNGCFSQGFANVLEEPCGDISGTVFEDIDNNDTGDIPIAGVVIKLIDAEGNVIAMDTTNSAGN